MPSTIPAVGFGLWKVPNDVCAETVYQAIKTGYRHIDSASDYGNEKETGEGIKRAIEDGLCTREELWITTKLWNTYHDQKNVVPALEHSLRELQLDYVDLFLIHFPIAQEFVPFETRYPAAWFFDPEADKPEIKLAPVPLSETWAGMETTVEKGLATQIGICNYTSGLLHDLMNYSKIKPSVLQIESHPYLTQERLIRLAKSYNLEVTAFSPLGALSYLELDMAGAQESVLEQAAVKAAAARVGRTPAQVVLRWGVQRGTSIIPKTSKPERMIENLSLFDFELNEEEMNAISALNSNRRFNDPGHFCEAAFNTFYPIYD